MLRKDPNRRRPRAGSAQRAAGASRATAARFVLYVEGARDRDILESWARRVQPSVARAIERNTVILGGRRPARAADDFRRRGGHAKGWRGLVVLDRDHHEPDENGVHHDGDQQQADGLELFVWGRRHIESYLLVPSAIRRVVGSGVDAARIEQALADPALMRGGDGRGEIAALHAKRILGAGGSLSEALGTDLHAGEIARAMRAEELHADVHSLLDRIGALSGTLEKGPEVVIRPPRG